MTIPCLFIYLFIARHFYNLKCADNKVSGAAQFVKQQTQASEVVSDINATLVEESKVDIEQEIKEEKKEIK